MSDEDMFKKQLEKFETYPNTEKIYEHIYLKEESALVHILDVYIDPVFLHDIEGNFIYVNEKACNFFGYTKDELMEVNLYDLNITEFSKLVDQMDELNKRKELIFQFTYFNKDESVVPVEIRSKLVELEDKNIILSIARDITEFKKIENSCETEFRDFKNQKFLNTTKDREEHLSLITDNMLDLMFQVNSEGIFEYVSPSIKELLGYEVTDIIGKRDYEFIGMAHPDDFETLIDTIQLVIQTLKPNRAQHRFKHADGHYIWVETVGNPLSNDKGEFSGAVYITRDITELKKVENQLKSSLKEKEVLLREIHHRVKNNMQIISSLLNLQSRRLTDEKTVNVLNESRNRVRSMAMVHEELYRSRDLSKIDFADYIRRLLSGLFSSYGVDKNLIKPTVKVENVLLNIDIAVPCGLIINELVSNSLKHAFMQGQKGKISIKFNHDGENYVLTVADNGIGFPENIDFKNTKTLGLQLINTLVKQLSGSIDIYKDKGTSFKIIF